MRLAADLGDVPSLAEEVETSRLRQSRTGGAAIGGGHGTERPLLFDDRPMQAARDVLALCRETAGIVVAGRGVGWPRDRLSDYSRFLLLHLEWLRDQSTVAKISQDLRHAISKLRHSVDRRVEREHWGWCGAVDYDDQDQPIVGSPPCTGILRAPQGARRATCDACGAVHQLDDERRRQLLELARTYVDGPPGLSQMFSRLARPLPEDTIRSWAARGRLVAHSHDDRGRAMYLVGDVMDLLEEQARRQQELAAKRDAEAEKALKRRAC